MARLPLSFAIGAAIATTIIWIIAQSIGSEAKDLDRSTDSSIESTTLTRVTLISDDPNPIVDCNAKLEGLTSLLEEARYCDVDSDCSLFTLGCPFGCTGAIRSTEIPRIETKYRIYAMQCPICRYRCRKPVFERRAVCEESRCVVTAETIETLREKTLKLLKNAGG